MSRQMRMTVNGHEVNTVDTFVSDYPAIAAEWDSERNNDAPSDCKSDSRRIVHWQCAVNPEHRWMVVVRNRINGGLCPGCVDGADRYIPKKKPATEDSFAVKFPEQAAEWHDVYNGNVTPYDITSGISHSKYWWTCAIHGVTWEATPYDRAMGKGCPLCRGDKISKARSTLKPGDSLAEKYPELTMEWDILRNETTPDKVFAHGSNMAHWVCPEPSCRNRYQSPIYSRTCNGSGCPVCSNKRTAEKGRIPESGHSLFDMYPTIASELVCSEYGETNPRNIAYSSGVMCTWKCSVCKKKIWDATPNSRTSKRKDVGGCNECAAKRIGKMNRVHMSKGVMLVDAAPDIANEWDHKRNWEEFGLELSEIPVSSNAWVYWICSNCHQPFFNSVNHRTSRGDGCKCRNGNYRFSFPEKCVLYYVQKVFPDAVGNASPDIAGLGKREFDIWIPSLLTAVEYDGQGWHVDAERDLEKELVCFDNAVRIIRIREPNCANYQNTLVSTVITRDPNRGYASLNEAILELFDNLGVTIDFEVDVLRDEAVIRKAMHLEFVKGSLAEEHPDIAKLWDGEMNGDNTPFMYKSGSTHIAYWKCPNGHSSYQQSILNRVKAGHCCCDECQRARKSRIKKPKSGRSLQDIRPDLADEWCQEMNGDVTPSDVGVGSDFVAYWVCKNHPEPYDMSVSSRTNKGSGCPFCSGKRVLTGFNDVATVRPEIADEWNSDMNGEMTPYNTLAGSHKKAYWDCPFCNSTYPAAINARAVLGTDCKCQRGKKISAAKIASNKAKREKS